MNRHDHDNFEQQVHAYVFDNMSRDELLAFEDRMDRDAQLQQLVQLEQELLARLQSQFQPPDVTAEDIERMIDDGRMIPGGGDRTKRRTLLAVTSAIAALIAWAIVAWHWSSRTHPQPFFEPGPLAQIHRQLIANGYRPYYFCEDEERFAMTFQQRQKTPLRLASTADDRKMIGLSYSGGLSRDTTSMLCEVRGKYVTVFIDRLEFDQPLATDQAGPDLHVFRRELGELVLYEVSPFNQPNMLSALRLGNSQGP